MRPIQFGDIKLLTQRRAFAPMYDYKEGRDAIYNRIRGDMTVMGYDHEVEEVVKQELGEGPSQNDYYRMEANARQKTQDFLDRYIAQKGEGYQALVLSLDVEEERDPLNPQKRRHQQLLIDGEDLARFKNDVFDTAYFGKKPCINPWSPVGKKPTPSYYQSWERYKDLNFLENAYQYVTSQYRQRILDEIAQGRTENILDLDAKTNQACNRPLNIPSSNTGNTAFWMRLPWMRRKKQPPQT